VEDLRADVDGVDLSADFDVDAVHVAANGRAPFEQRDVVVRVEEPGKRNARNAAAHDHDAPAAGAPRLRGSRERSHGSKGTQQVTSGLSHRSPPKRQEYTRRA
jgi:hypothetical protein